MNDVESLRLALDAEKFCHRADNAYLLARAEEAEAAAKDFAHALRTIREEDWHGEASEIAEAMLERHPGWDGMTA